MRYTNEMKLQKTKKNMALSMVGVDPAEWGFPPEQVCYIDKEVGMPGTDCRREIIRDVKGPGMVMLDNRQDSGYIEVSTRVPGQV